MQKIKLLLACPYCGGNSWLRTEDGEGEFECATCHEYIFPEEMTACASDSDDPASTDK